MNENFQMLANAIVERAASDYRRALRGHGCDYKSCYAVAAECEKFFLSDYFTLLTDLDGALLLKQLKQEYEDESNTCTSDKRSRKHHRKNRVNLLRQRPEKSSRAGKAPL